MSNKELEVICLSESDDMREVVKVRYYGAVPEVGFEMKYMVNQKAQFAMDLMRTNGVLLGEPGGEDSVGRAKLDLMSPQDIVNRAVAISDLTFDAFANLGWQHPVTPYEEMLDKVDAYREAEKETA